MLGFTMDWPIRGFLSETKNFMLIYSDEKCTAAYDNSPANVTCKVREAMEDMEVEIARAPAPSAQLDGEKAAEAQPETEKGGHQGMSPKHCQSARGPLPKKKSLLVSIDIPIPKD